MKQSQQVPSRIFSREQLSKQINVWRLLSKKIVFTNGVFDIIHAGHLSLLSQAAAFGDFLIVGINSDASVKRLKGDKRPIIWTQSSLRDTPPSMARSNSRTSPQSPAPC